ncbi:MAG: xanthan lyase, partial [Bacteroidales bacterium]
MKNSLITLAILMSLQVSAQTRNGNNWRASVDSLLNATMKKYPTSGKAKIVSFAVDKNNNKLSLRLSDSFANIPHRKSSIDSLYAETKKLLPAAYASLDIVMTIEGKDLGYYIPNALRKVRTKAKDRMLPHAAKQPAWVRNKSLPYKVTEGLQGNHIALWQSHGLYFEKKLDRWEWQRAKYFQTVEDLFTQSFVLPYLVPMLDNAGAVTVLPRERDVNTTEIIIDKDRSTDNSKYLEIEGKEKWKPGSKGGFAHLKSTYVDGENPFDMGEYRYIMSTTHKDADSKAIWKTEIPEKGEYAVYVSYKSLPASPTDALYTVHHAGGKTEFRVNQRMGGGTWVYLGTFPFKPGDPGKSQITLSNYSKEANRIVSADAVKIGGGMGNIARSSQKVKIENNQVVNAQDIQAEVSGMPRFTEGARYWMQWAGVPYKVYSPKNGDNDYVDDFSSRGAWVNYLAGGSRVQPDSTGLNVPIDLAFAFHSDAGTSLTDSIVGTLGIYYSKFNKGKYADGTSRMAARDLTDIIQSEVIEDVRAQFDPDFTRRAMWNKSYSEARVPEVPTMLLELLSHQNLADMRYGLDPRFRFTVSRAIYKGMLKFIASRENRGYVVQPLPGN